MIINNADNNNTNVYYINTNDSVYTNDKASIALIDTNTTNAASNNNISIGEIMFNDNVFLIIIITIMPHPILLVLL